MAEPLRDAALFRRVFAACGVPAWPNGFDLDAIALYREMEEPGLLIATPPGGRCEAGDARAARRQTVA